MRVSLVILAKIVARGHFVYEILTFAEMEPPAGKYVFRKILWFNTNSSIDG